ncbi:MAG: dienelactone hydrolase family protein [Pseudomonadota bacterium]
MLANFSHRQFSAALNDGTQSEFDVYTRQPDSADGPQPTVVIIQELPGIGPETISLADTFVEQGFSVVLPHLFGPLGKISLLGNMGRVICMRKEFRLLEKNASSPVVDWLKALCRHLLDSEQASGVGVIGMCLTGNFAISMMADEAVLAGVASQPSMPFFDQDALHMSDAEVQAAKARLDEHGPMLALRFEGDPLCTAKKFKAIDGAFNDGAERIKLVELPGKGHSVLTLDLIKAGAPGQDALNQVLGYFNDKLMPNPNPAD